MEEKRMVEPPLNTNAKEMNDNDMEVIIRHLGNLYRQASMRIDLEENEHPNEKPSVQAANDSAFIYRIDRSLLCCSTETQWVIRREFLEANEKEWYLRYISKYSFRRMRKKAIREFLGILDLVRN